MPFDINEVIAGMAGAIKDVAGENWPEVRAMTNEFFLRRKARLELLARFRLDNKIDDDELLSRLEDEKLLLDSEMHNVAIITKAVAEKAANAAIDVLQQAILSAVKLI